MFQVWLTKHVCKLAGTNQQFSHWKENVNDPMCPCCGKAVKITMHITHCSDPNRRQMFCRSASNLTTWMAGSLVNPVLIDMVEQYLCAQGERTMLNCLTLHTPNLVRRAEESDGLHWDSFLEERISKRWLDIMKPGLLASTTRLTPTRWETQFIKLLLKITYKLWLFRNSEVHF